MHYKTAIEQEIKLGIWQWRIAPWSSLLHTRIIKYHRSFSINFRACSPPALPPPPPPSASFAASSTTTTTLSSIGVYVKQNILMTSEQLGMRRPGNSAPSDSERSDILAAASCLSSYRSCTLSPDVRPPHKHGTKKSFPN